MLMLMFECLCLNGAKYFIFMDNTLKPVSYSISIGSLFMKISYLTFLHCMNGSHDVFHENKLPYICSMYDTGFNVLSMKIKYMKECEVANFHE
jgi:hypothetical protein